MASKTGIFGGTFNPPHNGHRHIVEGFREQMGLDRVLIIPSYIPPHKAAPDLASGEARLAMCKMTFPEDHYDVLDIEVEREGKSYTLDTLKELIALGYEDLYFLVGDDMLLFLDQWHEPNEILSLCHMVSSVRSDEVSVEELREYARTHFPKEYEDGRFVFLPMEPFPVSSTEIREKVREGRSIAGLVDPGVEDYIRKEGLYQ